jgi:hypothetical protein
MFVALLSEIIRVVSSMGRSLSVLEKVLKSKVFGHCLLELVFICCIVCIALTRRDYVVDLSRKANFVSNSEAAD